MNSYLILMHKDVPKPLDNLDAAWGTYLAMLREHGALEGGSAIGGGTTVSKREAASITEHLGGYIRVQAESLDAARALVAGNPVYEAGGTVEIRELPRTG